MSEDIKMISRIARLEGMLGTVETELVNLTTDMAQKKPYPEEMVFRRLQALLSSINESHLTNPYADE